MLLKHEPRGRPGKLDLPDGYVEWLLTTFKMTRSVRDVLRAELRRRGGKPRRKGEP
jgi:hypothetical protein